MKLSIYEALKRLRPDLTKSKRFRPLSPERRKLIKGDYRDPDLMVTAEEGTLSSIELAIGNEINRQVAVDAEKRLIEQDRFYRRHLMGLTVLMAVAAIGAIVMLSLHREPSDAHAGRTRHTQAIAAAAQRSTQADSASHAQAATAAGAKAGEQPVVINAARPYDEDEIPVYASAPPQPKIERIETLNPIARREGKPAPEPPAAATMPPPPAQSIAAAPQAEPGMPTPKVIITPAINAPAPAPAQSAGGSGLEDGAAVANQSSLEAAQTPANGQNTEASNDEPLESAGEVLYESAPAPSSTEAGARPRRRASSGAAADSARKAQLQCTGIFWDKVRPLALINDQIVEVGATVNGARVTAITKTGVTIEKAGKSQTLQP